MRPCVVNKVISVSVWNNLKSALFYFCNGIVCQKTHGYEAHIEVGIMYISMIFCCV